MSCQLRGLSRDQRSLGSGNGAWTRRSSPSRGTRLGIVPREILSMASMAMHGIRVLPPCTIVCTSCAARDPEGATCLSSVSALGPHVKRPCRHYRLTSSMYLFHNFFCSSVPSQTKLTTRISSNPSSFSGFSSAVAKVPKAVRGKSVRSGSSAGP